MYSRTGILKPDSKSTSTHDLQIVHIGSFRAQNEPRHGGVSTYETFILWLKFEFYHRQQDLPGLSLGMLWPAATYDITGFTTDCDPHIINSYSMYIVLSMIPKRLDS